jgi:hypothetical protein
MNKPGNMDTHIFKPATTSRAAMERVVKSPGIPLLLVFATIAAYIPILGNGFVGLDDPSTVYENWSLTHLSASSFFSLWTTPQRDLYAPLTYSLFAAISLVARIRPVPGQVLAVPFHAWPFHAVSLLLHVLSVLVVYRLLRRLIAAPWPAAAGALLFSLHPVQVESVAWVTETNNLLCGFLSLSAILLYLHATMPASIPTRENRTAWSRFALASEVFILAMLAKPLAVIVPLLAWSLAPLLRGDVVASSSLNAGSEVLRRAGSFARVTRLLGVPQNRRLEEKSPRSRRNFWFIGIWFLLAAPFAIIARRSQEIPAWWLVVPARQRPVVAADALAFYIGKLLWPASLTPDYGRSPAMVIAHEWAYYTWLVPAILAAGLFILYRRQKSAPLIAGAGWFVAALLPVLGLTPFAYQRFSTVADRYLYLPMFGVALAVAWGLSRVGKSKRRVTGILCVVVLAAMGIRSYRQCRIWHDRNTLFEHSIQLIGREPGIAEWRR